MSLTSKIIPAIIPRSYDNLVTQIATISGLPEVHVDVVDGVFVPAISWPYREPVDVTMAFGVLEKFSLEVDLMVAKPLPAALEWLKAGADQLVFHIETIESKVLENFTHAHAVTVGVALSSDTPLEALYPYLPFVEYVQVMGIATIGAQGQPFDDRVIDRIKSLREAYPSMPISIDGSVNNKTISQLKNLGLQRFIVGSAIVSAENPKDAYYELTKLTQS
jgi:ribulose-phosphate 3-epimerase